MRKKEYRRILMKWRISCTGPEWKENYAAEEAGKLSKRLRCGVLSQNGFRNISVKGSVGNILIQPHFYTREFFALIKEIIVFTFLK